MPPRKSAQEPQIIEMPAQKMAQVIGKGAPDKVFSSVLPALYGSVYTLKFALKKKGMTPFKVEAPRARYPYGLLVAKDRWTIVTGVPVPEDTAELPQKVPGVKVELVTWQYGTVAQILHLGAYDQEQASVEKLQQHIEREGYRITGSHEEEYLTRPDAKVQKTIIRYPVRKKK